MTVTYVGAGAGADNSIAFSCVLPVGLEYPDLALWFLGGKPYSSTPTPADTTWGSALATATSGTVAGGNSTGSVVASVFSKMVWSGDSGGSTGNVSMTSMNPLMGQTVAFRPGGGYGLTAVAVGLTDTDETGTTVNATAASDPGVTAGDMLVVHVVTKDDTNSTHSSQVIAVPGCTLGTTTWLTKYTTGTGFDGAYYIGYVPVTAGSSSGPATYTATAPASGYAAVAGTVVRLREVVVTNSGDSRLAAQSAQVVGTAAPENRLAAQSVQVVGVVASSGRLAAQSVQVVTTPYEPPPGPAWSVWNGTTEVAATVTVWNGTTEVATTTEVVA